MVNISQLDVKLSHVFFDFVAFFVELFDKNCIGMATYPSFLSVLNFSQFFVQEILLNHETFKIAIINHNEIEFS